MLKLYRVCLILLLGCPGVLLVAPFGTAPAHAQQGQGIERYDFSEIDVDELTDQQIREVIRRAEDQGLTASELEKMALARGMRPSEVIKFRERIYQVQREDRMRDSDERRGARQRSTDRRDEPRRGRDRLDDRRDRRPSDERDRRDSRDRRDRDDRYADDEYFDSDFYESDDPLSILTRSRDTYRQRTDTMSAFRSDTTRKRIFGASLFRNENMTFEPSLDIPTPRDYRLASGDELIVNIWGAAEMTYELPVERDGSVRVDNLGPIHVDGLTIEEAERRILGRLTQLYAGLNASLPSESNVFADVTLGSMRSIKVHILGEVNQPGSYTLPAVATVFNALYVCSGPNDNGTYRRIQVIRDGQVVSELDVYDFLIYGRLDNDIRLRDQDIVKVDPYLTRVSVEGEVKRPGYFEMRPGETAAELIRFAGSFTGEAYTRRLKVYRSTDIEKEIVGVSGDALTAFPLQNGDEVFVDPVLKRFANRVQIRGAVFRKGDYELQDARTVYGLIQRAEGLRGDAFMTRGHIYRTTDELTSELISFDLGKLMANPELHDVPLKKDDVVVIPSIFDLREDYEVTVEGSVQQPDSYPYMEQMTLKDLIVMAGGFKEEASLLRVEVSRRRTEGIPHDAQGRTADIFYFDVDRNLKLEEGDEQFVLQPFDKVFVRKSPGYIEQRDVTVSGEVLYPGTYTIQNKNTRISDIIERTGGLTPEAYPRGASLTRTRSDTGAVGIDLERILGRPDSEYDLLVQNGDSIHIPVRLETVKIEGAVYFPVSVRYRPGLDLMDYVNRAGGPTDQADVRRIYVVYANGAVDRVRDRMLFGHQPEIEPGVKIVVPAKPPEEGMSSQERAMILSSIVSVTAVVSTTIFQLIQLSRN